MVNTDHVANEEVVHRAKIQPLRDIVTERRISIKVHILRRSDIRLDIKSDIKKP